MGQIDYNPFWGSKSKDNNGALIEDFLDKYSVVMLKISVNFANGSLSCIDLARCGEWDRYIMRSDNFPI